MDVSRFSRRYRKDLPGATLRFQPSDMHAYDGDEWDIRISVADAPLDEAYYFTVKDPEAVNGTIEDLLERYALNPDCRDQLDVADYPDLPFLQEELIQYRRNAQRGLLDLEYYINHHSSSGPVPLYRRAKELLCTCTYEDGSHDYRVLDLVFVPSVPHLDAYHLQKKQRAYGRLYLLLLLEHYRQQDPETYRQFLRHPALKTFFERGYTHEYPALVEGFKQLDAQGYLTRGADPATPTVTLTEKAVTELQALGDEIRELGALYDRYDSVSIWPAALGIPNGFDARIQLMEYDGRDCERSVLLCVLDQNRDSLFAPDAWFANYESFGFFHIVQDALAYKTNFTVEVLEALQALGHAGA